MGCRISALERLGEEGLVGLGIQIDIRSCYDWTLTFQKQKVGEFGSERIRPEPTVISSQSITTLFHLNPSNSIQSDSLGHFKGLKDMVERSGAVQHILRVFINHEYLRGAHADFSETIRVDVRRKWLYWGLNGMRSLDLELKGRVRWDCAGILNNTKEVAEDAEKTRLRIGSFYTGVGRIFLRHTTPLWKWLGYEFPHHRRVQNKVDWCDLKQLLNVRCGTFPVILPLFQNLWCIL
jgi:hypothetical protein